MPVSSLELPKIPAATIFALRSKEGLEAADYSTRQSRSLILTEQVLKVAVGQTMLWDGDEKASFATGAKVAKVINHQFIKDSIHPFKEEEACDAELKFARMRLGDPAKLREYTQEYVEQVQDESNALDTFESIALTHTGEDDRRLAAAKRGAATLHFFMYRIHRTAIANSNEGFSVMQDGTAVTTARLNGHLSLVL